MHAGVVTVVQRFRSDLGLYVHLHCLVTAGAYEEQDDGELGDDLEGPHATATFAQRVMSSAKTRARSFAQAPGSGRGSGRVAG